MQIGASSDPEYQQAHAFSVYLVQPLLATSMALLSYNWYLTLDSIYQIILVLFFLYIEVICIFFYLMLVRYPSSVFVGDTYTYFAVMTMAVVVILGHFMCILHLFNFLLFCFTIN